ncbi:MAG: ribonuclease R [Pseudomonadota bacterium]
MSDLPSKDAILDYIREHPNKTGKREIARAFGLTGADRIALKRLLKSMQEDGDLQRRRRKLQPAGTLAGVTMIEVTHTDGDGDLFARPAEWEGDDPPTLLIIAKASDPALARGDRVLAKTRAVYEDTHQYEARPIRRIEKTRRRMVGLFRKGSHTGRIEPLDKRAQKEWIVPLAHTQGAKDGDLVEAEGIDGPRSGLPRGRIIACHGDPRAARQVSLIAMVQHQIPHEFPREVDEAAARAKPLKRLGKREDLRDLPLITIDPADARDHDDAIAAMLDDDPKNPGGFVIWVAIADVAHYVPPGSALDREARTRGNSTYFPDRVSPMLPEALSADLCSLMEGVDRPCMAVRMVLDAGGAKIGHRFTRGLMRSPASLDYQTVQAAVDGAETPIPPDMVEGVLRPLFAAYHATKTARAKRQPLDLDLPERQIRISDDGEVSAIAYRDRLDAHRLVEEFMILANVAAAETLEGQRSPLIYRVHEEPDPERLESLRDVIDAAGLSFAKGQVLQTKHLNQILAQARGTDHAETVAMSVLRSQQQAYYGPENLGHFGLNLKRYAHFTSPIRRYADLIVHRALISALGLGDDGLAKGSAAELAEVAEHISRTERRSMEAERDTVDRYVAAYLSDREGAEFEGVISGTSRAGAFVRLTETGADGLIPISSLGTDYFHHDRASNTLTGERTGRIIGLGLPVTVRLIEATPVTGGLILELLSIDGTALQRPTGRRGKGGAPRPGRGKGKTRPKRRAPRQRG